MSREIKFRCWRDGYMCSYYPNWYFVDNGLYWEERDADPDKIGSGEAILMQYTGLKDKNGVEKYQDDIVRTNGVDGELLWRIVWSELDVLSGFDYEPIGHSFSSVHNRVDEDAEVIGNIYENPELLQGGESE